MFCFVCLSVRFAFSALFLSFFVFCFAHFCFFIHFCFDLVRAYTSCFVLLWSDLVRANTLTVPLHAHFDLKGEQREILTCVLV